MQHNGTIVSFPLTSLEAGQQVLCDNSVAIVQEDCTSLRAIGIQFIETGRYAEVSFDELRTIKVIPSKDDPSYAPLHNLHLKYSQWQEVLDKKQLNTSKGVSYIIVTSQDGCQSCPTGHKITRYAELQTSKEEVLAVAIRYAGTKYEVGSKEYLRVLDAVLYGIEIQKEIPKDVQALDPAGIVRV